MFLFVYSSLFSITSFLCVFSCFFAPFVGLFVLKPLLVYCPVGWGGDFRIHRLLLCRGLRLPQWMLVQSAGAVEYTDCFSAEWVDSANECSGYDTKQYYGKARIILELWGMQSTPFLPSLPGPLGPGVITPDRVLSMGQFSSLFGSMN